MIDRINMLLKAKNITVSQFTQAIKIQRSGMSHILSGRNKPSLDFVLRVLKRYPEINPSWLLLGEGEMYLSDKIDVQTSMFSDKNEREDIEHTLVEDNQSTETLSKETKKTIDTIPIIGNKPQTRKIEKIIVLYSDNTFDEYLKE